MPVDIAAMSYLLSSVASTAKIIEFGIGLKGRRPAVTEIENVRRKAEEEATKRFRLATPSVVAMSGKMSSDIVQTIRTRIEAQKEKIIEVLSDKHLSNNDTEEKLNVARREFCWTIHQIKHHNGGVLPPDLQTEWDLNLCDKYGFKL